MESSETPEFIQTPPESQPKVVEASTLEVMPKKQLPSAQTLELIARIKKRGRGSAKESPVQHLLNQQRITTTTPAAEDLSFKYEDLVKGSELVMPLKYKVLARQMSNLDSCVSFLKHGRRMESLSFTEVCESVKQTFGREMNVNIFRQILSIVPEFYTHAWINGQLTLEATQDLRSPQTVEQRLAKMNQRLMERVRTKFFEFCESHQISDPQRYIENRVWHHAFDPNIEASDVELTNLNPQPVANRPETFRSYLNRSAVVA